jgi:hypothetical protein
MCNALCLQEEHGYSNHPYPQWNVTGTFEANFSLPALSGLNPIGCEKKTLLRRPASPASTFDCELFPLC